METVELKYAPEVKRVIQAGFPEYKKHKAFLSVFPEGGWIINSFNDGGTRHEFAIVELATLKVKPLPTNTHPYFEVAGRGMKNMQNEIVAVDHVGNIILKVLPPGFALVAAGWFCGVKATAHVFVNQENMSRLLPSLTNECIAAGTDWYHGGGGQ